MNDKKPINTKQKEDITMTVQDFLNYLAVAIFQI